jgi:hypothetical protein
MVGNMQVGYPAMVSFAIFEPEGAGQLPAFPPFEWNDGRGSKGNRAIEITQVS